MPAGNLLRDRGDGSRIDRLVSQVDHRQAHVHGGERHEVLRHDQAVADQDLPEGYLLSLCGLFRRGHLVGRKHSRGDQHFGER